MKDDRPAYRIRFGTYMGNQEVVIHGKSEAIAVAKALHRANQGSVILTSPKGTSKALSKPLHNFRPWSIN